MKKQTILNLKHWQILLLFVTLLLIAIFVVDNILILLDIPIFDPKLGFLSSYLTFPLYFIYPLLTGKRLSEIPVSKHHKQTGRSTLLLAGSIFVIVNVVGIFATEPNSIPAAGLAIVSLVCIWPLMAFPGRQLKSIELKRTIGHWEHASDTLQFLIWPLGIFWLQPRINAIVDAQPALTINKSSSQSH